MGQKVNPHGLRVGVIQDWNAKWIADKKNFASYIKEDDTVRTFLKNKYYQASISKIVIERNEGKVIVDIHTGRPGVLIGKAGAGAEEIKSEVAKVCRRQRRHHQHHRGKTPRYGRSTCCGSNCRTT